MGGREMVGENKIGSVAVMERMGCSLLEWEEEVLEMQEVHFWV